MRDTGRGFCIFFCSWLVHLKKELSEGLYLMFWNNINSELQSVIGIFVTIARDSLKV